MVKRMITITSKQQDFLKEHYINFPQFVRDKIDELIEEKKREEEMLTKRGKKNGYI